MKDLDSRQVIAHIDEAQNWLDKAKDEYTELNALQGDLHLNLAQAEVRYAWELSYQGNVSRRKVRAPKNGTSIAKSWNGYLLPVAAALIVAVLGGVLGLHQMGAVGPEAIRGSVADRQATETDLISSVQSEQLVAEEAEAAGNDVVPVEWKQEKVVPVQRRAGADLVQTLAVSSDDSVALPSPSSKTSGENAPVRSHQSGGGKVAVSNTIPDNGGRERPNSGRIHPVSVWDLTFDEEALTREATQSLRLGK